MVALLNLSSWCILTGIVLQLLLCLVLTAVCDYVFFRLYLLVCFFGGGGGKPRVKLEEYAKCSNASLQIRIEHDKTKLLTLCGQRPLHRLI